MTKFTTEKYRNYLPPNLVEISEKELSRIIKIMYPLATKIVDNYLELDERKKVNRAWESPKLENV